ncbi:hypothetical protein N2K95_10020 [Arthrobacter zhaoxinii]|uniref:DUF6993 domain-containing protein n=1 Tax=Arthrobacter zhaoxinii TaxID=2964616 RepID=A0ABY5YLQ5_9MICC|nr:hypothetical protein [Arthrobacter zhaoxinii]UWX96022.1 hypothetical protein N2K95_10020 [Arthrobacter zhaoxinii]
MNRRPARPSVPAAVLGAAFLALAVGLSGCGSPGEDNTAPLPRESAAPESVPADTAASPTPAPAPDDAPAAVTAALQSELGKLADADPTPDRSAVAGAFTAAGFPADSVEVSADRTPTGLEVDSIQAAAVQDGECIFGEVRNGSVSVTVLPVLSDGGCFVGN